MYTILSHLQEQTFALPLQTAIAMSKVSLCDSNLFAVKVVKADTINDSILFTDLPSTLQEFFRAYEEVRFNFGEMFVSSKCLRKSQIADKFIQIGYDIDNTEIVVKAGHDELIIATQSSYRQGDYQAWPSIYHYICYLVLMKHS